MYADAEAVVKIAEALVHRSAKLVAGILVLQISKIYENTPIIVKNILKKIFEKILNKF